MTTFTQQQTKVPIWLLDALQGEAPKEVLNKRSEPRYEWLSLASLGARPSSATKPVSVKVTNVSSRGVGLVSRTPVDQGGEFQLTPEGVAPDGASFDPVRVSVIHCTQAVQGYKIGCVFV